MGLRPKVRICPCSGSYKNYRKSLLLRPARIMVSHNTAKHSSVPNCAQLLIYKPTKKTPTKPTWWPRSATRMDFSGRWLDNPHSSGDGQVTWFAYWNVAAWGELQRTWKGIEGFVLALFPKRKPGKELLPDGWHWFFPLLFFSLHSVYSPHNPAAWLSLVGAR